jgi:hypothetical protein
MHEKMSKGLAHVQQHHVICYCQYESNPFLRRGSVPPIRVPRGDTRRDRRWCHSRTTDLPGYRTPFQGESLLMSTQG